MRYGAAARLLHWVMAVLVLLMIPAGLVMTGTVSRPVQDALFIFHKNTGFILLVLLIVRLAWRIGHTPPPLPASVPQLQQLAAKLTHVGLYFFLAVMVVSGYVRVTTGGFPIELLDALGVPPLLPRADGVAKIASTVHAVAKSVLIVLVFMHVGAAAFHGIVKRDGVFSRMWPPLGGAV